MNTQIQDIKKMLRVITIILIGSTLLTPFIFSGDMFFPFITGKAFFMRIMIVLSSISYMVLAMIDKNSRPKKSPMIYAVGIFMIILILATINSINPTRSLWSNFERMEGLVTMLYMAVLFTIATATIRRKEWSYIMNTSIIISLIVGINALSSATNAADRISGHLGNSSYLGVYALIHIFFGLLGALMIFRGNREKELLENGEHKSTHRLNTNGILYIVLFSATSIFNAFVLYKTGTRGAFVGLVIGLVLSSIYFAWKEKNKIIKFAAIGFLAAVVLSVSLLGIFKHSAIVQNSNQLNRFAGLITTDLKSVLNNQGQARTMIWGMAFEGVKERPLLGWGQDNFGYVFAKYYNPHMYGQEQWFDRSHNVLMDWLIASGFLGLLAYLSLFVISIYFLFSKKSGFTVVEKSILLGLFASYFVHNLFVFDNLSSYVLFFLILAYINDKYTHDRNEKIENKNISEEEKNKFILIGFISLLVIIFLSYQTVLKPFTQNKELIDILQNLQNKGVSSTIDRDFKNVFELSPNGAFESFEQFSNLLPKILSSENVATTTRQNVFTLYKDITDKYDKEISNDARYNYFVANAYRAIGMKEKSDSYIDKAYKLSPEKQSFAYVKALSLMDSGNIEDVKNILKKAYMDAPENLTAFGYYSGILLEIVKRSNYDAVKINDMAETLVNGYRENHHDILLRKELWILISDRKIKMLLANKVMELLPEEKDKILEVVK